MSINNFEVVKKIEEIILQIIVSIVDHQKYPEIFYTNNQVMTHESILSYEKNPKRFVGLITIMNTIHTLLLEGKHCTKKDLYYSNVPVYENYQKLIRLIDVTTRAIEVPRNDLNIISSNRSIVVGDISYYENGKFINCRECGKEGILIPPYIEILSQIRISAKFLLVVEDDATFQRLIHDQFIEKHGPCILVTSKGYPDYASRQFVKLISEQHLIPTFGLFDCDVYGVEILFTYAFGGENGYENERLRCPRMEWIGLHLEDIRRFNISPLLASNINSTERKRYGKLQRKAFECKKSHWSNHIEEMLQSDSKFEIQSLMTISIDFLSNILLPKKINEFLTRDRQIKHEDC